MGQHTLLRTMTRKSLMKFGEYYEYTVDQLLQLKLHSYLRWVYYNCEQINFTIDILEEIHIDEMQIDKPGKDIKTYEAVHSFFSHFVSFKTKSHLMKKNRQIAKANLISINKMKYSTKSYMQGRNHGR